MSDVVKRLRELQQFLSGATDLTGVWFGEPGGRDRDRPKPFWWRTEYLPVMEEAAAEITRLRAREATLSTECNHWMSEANRLRLVVAAEREGG